MTKTIAALAIAATMLSTWPAHADPTDPKDQDTYIDSLITQELMSKADAQEQRAKLLDLGNMVCTDKASGLDNDEIVPLIRRQGQINSFYANMIIMTAIHHLC